MPDSPIVSQISATIIADLQSLTITGLSAPLSVQKPIANGYQNTYVHLACILYQGRAQLPAGGEGQGELEQSIQAAVWRQSFFIAAYVQETPQRADADTMLAWVAADVVKILRQTNPQRQAGNSTVGLAIDSFITRIERIEAPEPAFLPGVGIELVVKYRTADGDMYSQV